MSLANEKLRRMVRFGVVGASGIPVDLAVTAAALSVLTALPAQVVGWSVAVSWNYHLNRRWTWDADGHLLKQWAAYASVDLGKLGVRLAVVWMLVGIGVGPLKASVVAISVGAAMGFVGIDRLVFR